MNCLLITSALSLVLLAFANADAQTPNEKSQAVEIPLDKIWAYDMPGTRDIGRLEPKPIPSYAYGPLIGDIRRALWIIPSANKTAKPGFVVLGSGMPALSEAHAILAKGKKPRAIVPSNSEASIVFFSHQFNFYVHIKGAELVGNIVTVVYQFVLHETQETTEHVALIPLGELPSGTYEVRFVQSPTNRKVSDADANRIVCRPFSFSVVEDARD